MSSTSTVSAGGILRRHEARVALMVIVASLPLLAAVAYHVVATAKQSTKDALARVEAVAQQGSRDYEKAIAEARTVLALVAQLPQVMDGPSQACRSVLLPILKRLDWAQGLWVIGENGRVRCSTVAQGVGVDLSSQQTFRNAVAADGFYVSNFFVGKVTDKPMTFASLQANSQSGERNLLAVTMNISWFAKLSASLGQEAGANILLLDGKGVAISAFPQRSVPAGKSLADHTSIKRTQQSSRGHFEGEALDETRAYWGFATLSGTDHKIAVAFPSSSILSNIKSAAWQAGLVGAFTLMLSAAFIWAIGQRLWANPMRKRDQLLQTALDSMDQGLMVVDKRGRLPIYNARALELLNLPEELMASEPALDTILAYQRSMGEFDNMNEGDQSKVKPVLFGGGRTTYVRERANGTFLEVHSVPIEGGGIVRTFTDVTSRKTTERHLQEQANSDGLTGLSNRRHFDKLFHTEFARARRTGHSLALIMIDIDHFKAYNDFYGHLLGDTCLQEVANTIDATLKRPADTASRYGGEEFAVLLPDTHLDGGIIVAEQIRKAIEARAMEHHGALTSVVTVSAGVAAVTPNLLSDEASLVRDADAELYEAKKAGRNQVAPEPIGTDPDRPFPDRRQRHSAPVVREPEPSTV